MTLASTVTMWSPQLIAFMWCMNELHIMMSCQQCCWTVAFVVWFNTKKQLLLQHPAVGNILLVLPYAQIWCGHVSELMPYDLLQQTKSLSEFLLIIIFVRVNSRKNSRIASVVNIVQKINIQQLYTNSAIVNWRNPPVKLWLTWLEVKRSRNAKIAS